MFRFDNSGSSTELAPPSLDKIDTTSETLPIDEAKSFWNDVFSKEADFSKEVSNCSEEDCKINFDANDKDIVNLLNEAASNWENFNVDEKMGFCENFVDILSEKLGLENPPDCCFYSNDDPGDFGFYYKDDNTINVNTNQFGNPNETLNTLAHETRHAYQNERADLCETYTDELYKYNLENYVSLKFIDGYCVNFTDYYDQLVEADARAFADLFEV